MNSLLHWILLAGISIDDVPRHEVLDSVFRLTNRRQDELHYADRPRGRHPD